MEIKPIEINEHIESLRREGDLMAAAAARSGPDASIPTCPGWNMRDLVRHTGGVHRWATAHVSGALAEPIRLAQPEDIVETLPDDAELVDWFREGHAALVGSLEHAGPDLACYAFLKAPSPLAFWARRQAHETEIHRVDAESPAEAITPFPTVVAVDGIDELLTAFLTGRGGRLRSAEPRFLHLRATDAGADWLVRIGPDGVDVTREAGDADCAVKGTASDLFMLVWNRRSADGGGIDVRGDRELLTRWRESVRIRWR